MEPRGNYHICAHLISFEFRYTYCEPCKFAMCPLCWRVHEHQSALPNTLLSKPDLKAEVTRLNGEVLRLKIALDAAIDRVTTIKRSVEAL